MTHSLTARPLAPGDAAAIAALIRAAFAAQPVPTDPPSSALRVGTADVSVHLQQGGGGGVIEADGAIVASVLWTAGDGLAIARLAVHPCWRRRGLAVRLLALAEAAASAAGLPRMTLETRLSLADNRRLFEGFGFREVSRHAHPGYAEPTYMLMAKPLSGTGHGMGRPRDRA
jgi:ribosomal protein S18 acetylase RimI-like enzyme